MIITTSSKIWAHRNFLTVVHQANEIIEREAGSKSETLAVYWGLTEAMPQSTPVCVGIPGYTYLFHGRSGLPPELTSRR